MPTYEYECDACGHHFDEFQSFSEEPLKKCPECKKNKLHRVIGSGAAILFKGSGFYQTDYRSESYTQAAKADQEGGSGTKGSDGASGTNGTSASKSSEMSAKSEAKSPKSKS
jgi:putative FmdB family regulatory protein